ncbi:hypothetical protein [Chryseobacterium sp.]|uniref:hypothetical protein n=1 Tax=Chryseobacterium sp. TaxID=1871047 RepID=UPI00289CC2B5|nr:hypothetical protein [Chryseobacterium sp.]
MKKLICLIFFLANFLILKAQIFSSNPYYSGYATLHFQTGVYAGNIINGRAQGQGIYYFYDGSIFQGNFMNGFQNGPGVSISRQFGYVQGCWNNGIYYGFCQGTLNPIMNPQAVQNVINNVQQNIIPQINQNVPTQNQIPSYNPTAYAVTQINSDSELGRQIASQTNTGR